MQARTAGFIHGGVHLDPHKLETQDIPSRRLTTPKKLTLPLRQHVGGGARPCVVVGQKICKGEVIATNDEYVGMRLHAPTSGVVSAIADRPVIHPSGEQARCVEIISDGENTLAPCAAPLAFSEGDSEAFYHTVEQAGIVGLGGAGFPSHVKIREGGAGLVEMLIVNGVECEPYITCDDRTIQEHASELVAGAELIALAIGAKQCVVAIEDDMPAATQALSDIPHDMIELVSVPAKYPAGSEKQLISIVTGREVPSGKLPIDVGVSVLNVATVVAIYRAVRHGEPLTERMLTVAGDVPRRGNVVAAIGSSVRDILTESGIEDISGYRVLCGGPMMGTLVHDIDSPITKTVNAILVLPNAAGPRREDNCIRCGDCVPVCPVGLQPQQLFEMARVSDLDATQDSHLFDCIECGCCAYVCPSRIPLVHYYRYAKASIESIDYDRAQADRARDRFVTHSRRDDRRSESDVVAGPELAEITAMSDDNLRDDIEAAVARARRRRGG